MNASELSVLFFVQVAVILLACKGVGWLGTRFGQPPVVGEMIAGVLLGPSLLGYFYPGIQEHLFPPASRPIIWSFAQIGLALYMFTVGLEFRVDLVRTRARSALAISFSGILVPFALGCGLAVWFVRTGGFFSTGVPLREAMLFLGASMAITAFPMLARIIFEQRLSGTTIGALALAAGAIDDASAWCVLAVVVAALHHDASIALRAIGGGVVFIGALFLVARPFLRGIAARAARGVAESRLMFGWMMVLLMLAAWFTDTIGLYAVFGAFFLGTAVPRGAFANQLRHQIEPLTSGFLVPMFFIYSGLNTRLDLVNDPGLWLATAAALAVAIAGKAGGCYLAARLCGENHRDAAGVGMLMNARGLMELIIINIGLERGIIGPTLFSILVFMAVVTTLMSTPLFRRVYGRMPEAAAAGAASETQGA